MAFPDSADYVFPHGLAQVHIDRSFNLGHQLGTERLDAAPGHPVLGPRRSRQVHSSAADSAQVGERTGHRGLACEMRLVEVGGIELDVHDVGTGDPVVLVQTALTADELAPLAEHLVARGAYRAIVYHRRGYASSSPVQGPGSVVRDAADCRDLIDALGLGRVHIVGYSYSGAVGLQLAADAVEHVQTLTLIEPPPVHVPSSEEFRAANARLQEVRRARGPGTALEEFLALAIGLDWRTEEEERLPGAAEQCSATRRRSSTPICRHRCPGTSTQRTRAASHARCCTSMAATAVLVRRSPGPGPHLVAADRRPPAHGGRSLPAPDAHTPSRRRARRLRGCHAILAGGGSN